ncbi:hypothetical protein ES332_A03G010700v1 [Gossypium tomentosum]|uniref:CCHC-type domain-containing protein n=1 Tax=Gossypium tomentosum TaxID=34277 RepID=A0A5D2R261_GOSTO|nr:hypothetical protein ES332_A03G010700v1 [Gossypium tomentosum]
MLVDAEAGQQVIMADVPSSVNLMTQQSADIVNNSSAPAYRPSNSRGRGHGRSSGRIQCQLCGKTGHLVDQCYHRFDTSYKSTSYRLPPQANMCMYGPGFPSWSSLPSMIPPPSNWSSPSVSPYNWSNPFVSNSVQRASTPSPPAAQPNAFLATAETVADNAWYPDSGATHHLTHSVSSLGDSTSRNGPVQCTGFEN